jgi:hypothetical protein
MRMIQLLQILIFGHAHKWRQVRIVSAYLDEDDKLPAFQKVVCECERCGTIRTFRT